MDASSLQALMSDPAILAQLQNTLTPAGLLSQTQALDQAQAVKLAQATKDASSAATAAGTQYQQAAAAPPPSVDPLEQLLSTISGGVGTAITGDQGFTQRAASGIEDQQKALMVSRIQNLQALKDSYDVKVQAATDAGNHELADAARRDSEKLARTLSVLLENQREQHATDLQKSVAADAMARVKETGNQAALTGSQKLNKAVEYVNKAIPGQDQERVKQRIESAVQRVRREQGGK